MAAPTIANSKTSTATKYGGDALNNVNRFLNGVDVTSQIGTPIIRTPTKIPSEKLIFTDPAEDNTVTIKIPSLSVNKNINLVPSNVVDNDEVLFKDTVQTVTGKVISASSNTLQNIDTSNLAASSDIITTTNTKTVSGKTILDSGTGNQIGVHIPYTYTIYQDASNYFLRNNWTGVRTSYAKTDIILVIEDAISGIVSVGNSNNAVFGGGIFIKKGNYTAITQLDLTITLATRNGIMIEGEGKGTVINFTPAGALTNGILVQMTGAHLKNMRIVANSNVTNIIHLVGNGTGVGRRNDYCIFENLMVEGPNGDAGMGSKLPISGQIGLLIDGSQIAVYFSQVKGCEFIGLETGLSLNGQHATSCRCIGNVFMGCEYGIVQDGGGQNIIDSCWIQSTPTVGTTGIWIKNAGENTKIDNIVTEMMRENPPGTDVACRSVLLDTGVDNIKVGQVSNVFEGVHSLAKTIVDNSGSFTNSWQRHLNVNSKNFIRLDETTDIISFNTSRIALFPKDKIYIADNDGSNNYILKAGDITGGAGTRNISLPDLGASSDTLVGRATTDTFTNKTLTTPTLTTPTVNGAKFAIPAAKTANYTATTTDYYIPVDATSGNLTIDLPAVSTNGGLTFIIWKTDSTANTVTVDGASAETINGAATMVLRQQYQHIRLECTGSAWFATRDIRMSDDTTNQALSFNSSAAVVFTNQQLRITDAVGTRNYLIKGGTIGTAGTKTIEIPGVSADDKFVLETTTQTLTNKTFNADGTGNSITNIENADIKAAAAIDVSKLAASGTVRQSLQTDASTGTTTAWRSKSSFVAGVLGACWKQAIGTSYADMGYYATVGGVSYGVATFTIDTTGCDRFSAVLIKRKGTFATIDFILVDDANPGTNTLYEFVNPSDGRTSSTWAALPAWCSGVNEGIYTIRLRAKSTVGTDDVRMDMIQVKLV